MTRLTFGTGHAPHTRVRTLLAAPCRPPKYARTMARWAPLKKDTLGALASEVLLHYRHGRTLVAVDGRHGVGQAAFADDLAEALGQHGVRTFRASIDGFFRPRADRERAGFNDPEAHWRGAYDLSLLRRVLTDPFRVGGSTGFVLAGFDEERDEPIFQPKWQSAGADAVLILDGVFLLRPELRGLWHYSIWLTAPITAPDPSDAPALRDAGADERYLRTVDVAQVASAIVDNSDPDHPRRAFADSC